MEEHLQMVKDCEKRSQRMSDWEIDFIASISFRLGIHASLTETQETTLNEIWDKVTARG